MVIEFAAAVARERLLLVKETSEPGEMIRSLSNVGGDDATKLRALLDLLPAAVLMAHDVGCKHVSVNRAAAQMLGVGSDANVSPHIADDNHAFHLGCKGKPICAEDAPIQIAASKRTRIAHGY